MTQYRLTSRETDLIEAQARRPAVSPLDMSWLPTQQVEDAYTIKDYVMKRVEPPSGSKLGEHSFGVSSAKTETERDLISFRYTYSVNKTDLRIASRNGYDIIGQNVAMMRSAMEHSIMKLVFQGNTGNDLPDISGMMDVGEDVNNSEETVYWATATSPVTHASYGFDDLQANNYFPPFSWILSRSLESGLYALNNAANPRTHLEIIRAGYVSGGVYFYQHGTSAYASGGYIIYPLPAATHDGLWLMFAATNGAGENNFYLAQVTNGIETTVPGELDANNMYTIGMEWRGTPVFRGATTGSAGSAPYIVFAPDVDFAS
jgi:hypothetical protein